MKESDIDTERLASLLDGRVAEAERAELLTRLAASDDDFHTFAETAAVLREAEEAEPVAVPADSPPTAGRSVQQPAPPPSTGASRGWRRPARWVALAAVLCLALSVTLLATLGRSGSGGPERMAVLLTKRDVGLPADWAERRPWGGALGSGTPLTPEARAARVGALHADLSVAIAAGQRAEASVLSAELRALLVGVRGSAPVEQAYLEVTRRAGDAPERLTDPLEHAGDGAAALLGPEMVELGAWTEAARVAAARRDAAFFGTRQGRAVLNRAAASRDLPPSATEQVERVRRAAEAGPDWAVLGESLDALLRTLAG